MIHADIDPAELGKRRSPTLALDGDLAATLAALPVAASDCAAWTAHCVSRRNDGDAFDEPPGNGVYAPTLLRELTRDATRWIICSDVGQHQMWVAQHGRFARPEQHLSSGGLGAMGFGVPAAIGAQLACPDREVLAVCGDGGFLMNVQELATIRRYDLPVKIVVIDNSSLGLVRQWQDLFFAGRFSEVDLSDNPDFASVAEAFGIPAFRLDHRRDVADAVARIAAHRGPLLAHVCVDARDAVWPLVPPNASNSQMLEGKPPCTTMSA